MVTAIINAETLDQEVKKDNRKVTYWLLNYHQKKKEIEQEKENLILSGNYALEDRPVIKATTLTDITGKKAVQLADSTAKAEEWLRLVEEVEMRLPWKLQLVLQLRREAIARRGYIKTGRYKGRPAWIPYVQHKFCEAVAKRTGKNKEDVWIESPSVFSEWWQRIVEYAARLAAKKGLL